jgi:hypothetical protein
MALRTARPRPLPPRFGSFNASCPTPPSAPARRRRRGRLGSPAGPLRRPDHQRHPDPGDRRRRANAHSTAGSGRTPALPSERSSGTNLTHCASRSRRGRATPSIDAIISTGGTGIARRDSTIDVVRSMLTHELDGFGELFRMLSYEQVGPAAMLSRAVGGLVMRDPAHGGDTFLFAVPGSVNAVETAVSKLIAPQLAHLVWERRK